ncbi:type 4 pilus major pilin [Stenotrophomonas maltophilia]|uniref:type 4 pilus major pilin n=1 Tax=Stenotrophomonas maltophilia TaxID=40324 RepID=UPI0009B2A39E|nr:type 4 pilus major pilin [Stenotrophomonas maltophilia]
MPFSRIDNLSTGRTNGFGLVEVLLVLGVASAMAAAGWLLFGPTSVAADVKQTQMDFSETATAIDRSLGIVGGFSGLSTALVRTDGLAAQRLRQGEALRNVWGGSVSFVANTVKRGNDSFLVETRDVPKSACVRLIGAMAGDSAVWDAQVNGQSVYVGHKYDPATATVACERDGGDRVGFVYFSGLASGSSVAVSPIALPPAPPSVDPVNASTPVGPVDGAPEVADAMRGTPGVVPPGPPAIQPPFVPTAPPAPATPTTPQPSPVLTPTPTPPPLATCALPSPASRTETESQAVGCPAGQLGSLTQSRSRAGTYACPEAWAAPVLTWGGWSAWATTSSTCAPACVLPNPSMQTNTETRTASQTLACPSGQLGSITQTRQEQRTQTRAASCPASTGAYGWGAWSAWSAWAGITTWLTTSNTCTTPTPPAKTYPSYSGKSWISWGDGGLYGWGVFCSASQFYADQSHCTQSVNTNDDATFSPVMPQEQALTTERRSCVAALQQKLTPMPGFGSPSTGAVSWPTECACETVGPGSAFYWQSVGASDWSAYEFKCP